MNEHVSRDEHGMRMTLREWRERRALSLRELAAASGVSYREVVRIAGGRHRPRPSTRRKIAAALGVEPWQLIFPTDKADNAATDS